MYSISSLLVSYADKPETQPTGRCVSAKNSRPQALALPALSRGRFIEIEAGEGPARTQAVRPAVAQLV